MNHSMKIASAPNLRDVGGYQTADGRTVRRAKIYRSEQLSGISDDSMKAIAALGLKKVYDLRTVAERSARPDELPPGVQDVVVDVLADSDQAGPAKLLQLLSNPPEANTALGNGRVVALFEQAYGAFITLPSAQQGFSRLYSDMLDGANLPALYHCTTGKDRTGWATAALLSLLGVADDVIMEDFLASNEYILPEYAQMIEGFSAAGGEKDIILAVLGVKREYLEASYAEMRDTYGSIENYFAEGLGLDQMKQQALRDALLE